MIFTLLFSIATGALRSPILLLSHFIITIKTALLDIIIFTILQFYISTSLHLYFPTSIHLYIYISIHLYNSTSTILRYLTAPPKVYSTSCQYLTTSRCSRSALYSVFMDLYLGWRFSQFFNKLWSTCTKCMWICEYALGWDM